jgi:hypothetical protein
MDAKSVWLCFAKALRSKTRPVAQRALVYPRPLGPCFPKRKHSHTKSCGALLAIALPFAVSLLAGCSGDPMMDLVSLNPWRREEWAADEQFGMNPHTRLAELNSLAERAAGMSPQDQERVSEDLAMQLRDEQNALFRARMVRVLGELKTASARQTLAAATGDTSPTVRIAACDAWARQRGPEAVESLAKVVGGDTDLDVRMAATRALGALDDPGAVRALALALDDSDPALQNRAMLSLREVSGQDYGLDVAAWRQYARGEDPQYEAPSIAERLRELF